MIPVRLVLASRDELYIELFLHYVHNSEFDRNLVVTAFSLEAAFHKYMESSGESVDAVLCEEAFLEQGMMDKRQRIIWMCLNEGSGANFAGYQVFKYQPLHELLSKVLEQIQSTKEVRLPDIGRAMVIGVYSAVGGCGKTTVALNLAKQLAAEGRKVFYLNLETFVSGILFAEQELPEGRGAGMARLLYDLKAAADRKEPMRQPISTYTLRHPLFHGDLLGPVDNINELLEMESHDTKELIDYIAGSGVYDVVIVDGDSYINPRTEGVLENANKVVWLVTDDGEVMRKTGTALAYLERHHPSLYHSMMNKVIFTLNRCSGERLNGMPRPDLTIRAALSLIPSRGAGSRQDPMMYSPVYQRDILRLCRELLSGNIADFSAREGVR